MADWEIVEDEPWEIVDETTVATPTKRTGLGAVAGDVWEGVKGVPGAIWDLATSLPGEALGVGKQVFTDPGRIAQNAVAGLASGGRGLLNSPANAIDYLKERELAPEWLTAARPESINNFDYRQGVGLEGQQPGDALVQGLAEFAPNLAPAFMSPTGAMALQAIGQNHNPVTPALIPSTIKGIGKVTKGIASIPVTPSGWVAKYAKDNISLSELADNLRAAEGTETPLGDVVRSPKLKKLYENKLAEKAPFEVEQTYKRINEQIQNRAEELIDKTLGENLPAGDSNILVKDSLVKAYKDNRTVKNNLYNQVSETADAQNFQLKLDNFEKLARENAQAIDDSPLLKNNSEFRKQYNKLRGLQQTKEVTTTTSPAGVILDEMGNPLIPETSTTKITRPSIRDANIIANDLYDSGQQMLRSPNAIDRQQGELYKRLASSLREDVQKSIAKDGSVELQEQYNSAKEYYKDEFVQFLDKDLYRILDESKDPQIIVRSIIKPSKKVDQYRLIEKVQKALPEEQKSLLGYTYLRGAINKNGILEPTEVNNLIKSLGPRQFKALFPDSGTRQAILDFSRLRNMNVEAANYLANPKTGARNQTFMKDLMGFLPEAVGGTAGVSMGGTLGALLGITITNLGKSATNKYLAKILTDPKFRTKVAEKITKEQGKKK